MNTVIIETKERKGTGTTNAKAERNAGQIPCVLYGGKETSHFTINAIEFEKLVNTPEVNFIELKQNGKSSKAVIKNVQFHPVTDHVLHVDFQEMMENKPVIMRLPIRLTGNARGVLNGGKLLQKMRKIAVKAMPDALPAEIVVDVTEMRIGNSIKVGELGTTEGLEFLAPDNSVVCIVKIIRGIVEEEVEAEETEGEEGAEGEAAEGTEGVAEGEKAAAPAEGEKSE